jgi:hypothetical protein
MGKKKNCKPKKVKAYVKMWKEFREACQANLQRFRQNGSLGHGSLRHRNVKSFVLPLVDKLTSMPRLTVCMDLVAAADSEFNICPGNQNQAGWVTLEGRKLHKWFLAAGRPDPN